MLAYCDIIQSMNDTVDKLKENIEKILAEKIKKEIEVTFEIPSNPSFGDISTNVAMKYAKEIGIAPQVLAEEIIKELKNNPLIKKAEAVSPGFINITLGEECYHNNIKKILKEKYSYGRNSTLKGQSWVVEHTSPNPNKAMHVGHLRNNLIGTSIVRLLRWNGAKVMPDAVDNNRGIAIAKIMYGFLKHMKKENFDHKTLSDWITNPEEWYTPKDKDMKADRYITECYVLAEEDVKDEEIQIEIQNLVISWEKKDKNTWRLWRHVLKYAYEGRNETLDRIGNVWDREWHESDHYEKGKEYIQEGVKKGIFKVLEDGAVLTDLEEGYNIPNTVLLRGDGTSLYITQDIALTDLKRKKYNADRMLWVVGPEQSLAFKQMFAVCEQLGIGTIDMFTHIPYGQVTLSEEGERIKMSSRKGNVVLIDDFLDAAYKHVLNRFKEEGREKESVLAEKLALAAVKFNFLKVDRLQSLTFDFKSAVETKGDSGVYALYTYVRTQSILREAKRSLGKNIRSAVGLCPVTIWPEIGKEKEVLKLLMQFPEIIDRGKNDLSVHHIAQYVLLLCSAFNSWYAVEKILDNSQSECYKLAVVESVGIVLKNALEILGIRVVEKI